MPVISSYVKAHQKYNIFKQYNTLISNKIIPVSVSVDGIEVREKCDNLFDMNMWKHEKIYTQGATNPSVIERHIPKHENKELLYYSKDLKLNQYIHIAGAGGNGKSQFIVNLAKSYPSIMFMAPTNAAVKNLLDRAKSLNITINCATYHKVFGFCCRDSFHRDKYTKFVLDECSMVSAENLRIMMNKMNKSQSLLIAGDFWQLHCIDDTPIFNNWTKVKSKEYEKFEIIELTKNWRQKEDKEFFDLCNKLRGKLCKDEAMDLLKVLNSRVIKSDVKVENMTLDDIHICGINSQVNDINKKHDMLPGCKVICNMSCKDKEGKKVPHNSIGIMLSLVPFRVQWDDDSISTFEGIGRTKTKTPRFSPAYALTVHKAQGRTVKRNVIINPSRLFTKNHLYVALTRATKFSNIHLTENMTFKTFCKTVTVEGSGTSVKVITKSRTTRLGRMVRTYIKEEPRLTVKYLQDMRDEQKNKCCYCKVSMRTLFGEPCSITLERIDDNKRHIFGNLKLACHACNSAHRKE